MSSDDEFMPRLGPMRAARASSVRGQLKRIVNLGGKRTTGKRGRRFKGSRIGRGNAVAALMSRSGSAGGSGRRRVIVKATYLQLAGKGYAAAARHLSYLQRDGTTREGERGSLYGRDEDQVDAKAFLERGRDDSRQFRFIVSAEDGAEYDDLKPLIRRLMADAERDLGARLDWIAVDHFDTGKPHSHIVVRGKDRMGQNLVIAPDYIKWGFRERASRLVELDLGPRSELEIARARYREMHAERVTVVDRRLLAEQKQKGFATPAHRDPLEYAIRMGRLNRLQEMGLAREFAPRQWSLDAGLERQLRAMELKGDRIRTLNAVIANRGPKGRSHGTIIHDGSERLKTKIIAEVIERGLADEHTDRHYLALDGSDGHKHYLELAPDQHIDVTAGCIVRLEPRQGKLLPSDAVIAEIASAHADRYSTDIHRAIDPNASDDFLAAHARRLEAVRNGTGKVERNADGSWSIGPDYLATAERHERSKGPVAIELLSAQPLREMTRQMAMTWLDEKLISLDPQPAKGSFGDAARKALDARRTWLIKQGLAERQGDRFVLDAGLPEKLRARAFRDLVKQLSDQTGRRYLSTAQGMQVEGTIAKTLFMGRERFAMIEMSREFTLVPWKPVLERGLGGPVRGIVRASGTAWEIGRRRDLGFSR